MQLRKKRILFATILLFSAGWLVLAPGSNSLEILQKLTADFLDVWYNFMSKDVVGIV